jgi:hypothetical protein
MSFIFEDLNLIEQLLVQGLEHELKFTKKGQAAAASADQNRTALLQHIKTLQDQLNPAGAQRDPNAGPVISHKGPAALGSPQLESLGDLVQWLANNESKVDGQVIAYPTKPTDDEEYIPYRLETHVATPQQRGQDPGMVYVNPALLQKYIVSLQASEAQRPNVVMQKQLSHLIQDANQSLGLNIDPTYRAPEKVLADTTVLDNVPQVINPQYPTTAGTIPLTYGDLKNSTSFNSWLNKNNIAVDMGDGRKMMINHPQFDFKKVVDAIVQRAQFMMSRAVDIASRDRAQLYVRQIDRVDAQLGGSTSKQPGVTNQGQEPANQQVGAGAAQALQDAVQKLPFSSRDINFDRIRAFFDAIKRLMGNDGRITKLINDTMQLMNSVNARMSVGDIFPMGVRPNDFASRFKNQQTPGRDYYGILKDLSQVINNTRMVAEFFWYQYAKKIPSQETYMMGQIGATPEDDSLYNQNAESLQDLNSVQHT